MDKAFMFGYGYKLKLAVAVTRYGYGRFTMFGLYLFRIITVTRVSV